MIVRAWHCACQEMQKAWGAGRVESKHVDGAASRSIEEWAADAAGGMRSMRTRMQKPLSARGLPADQLGAGGDEAKTM